MEECVITGRTLVIVDVDPNSLLDDHMMVQLLSADYPLKQARKAQVGRMSLYLLFKSVAVTCIPTS